jgi:hypothetical protein
MVGFAHIECACARQNHDEPKQELRKSLHGFQNPFGLSHEVSGHSTGRSLNLHASLPFANSASTVRNTRAPLGKSLGEARKFALLNSQPGIFIRAALCC